MTTPEHEQPSRDASPGGRFEALLAESGVELGADDALVSALADLESLGSGNPPVPSPTLRDLLEAPDAAHLAPGRRPGPRRARVAVATLTVAACLSGAGVAAAAASNAGFRQSMGDTIATVVGTFAGARHVGQSPRDGSPAPVAEGTTPASAATPTATRVLGPDTATPGTSAPERSAGDNPDPQHTAASRQPILPTQGWRAVTPTPVPPTESVVPSPAHTPQTGAAPTSHTPAPGRSASPGDPHPSGPGQSRP